MILHGSGSTSLFSRKVFIRTKGITTLQCKQKCEQVCTVGWDRIMAIFSVFAVRSKFTFKLLVILMFATFFYCEYVSYWILPWTWIKKTDCKAPQCSKLLLIADPQIIGPEWNRVFFMDTLAIWDSDRYLKRTFQKAVNYIQPDIVIFLGDLMDQGHLATDMQFQWYTKRVNYLFELPSSLKNTKVIFSPGDNDIGGVEDVLLPSSVHRFKKMFNQTEECDRIENIEFCKVDVMTSAIQESKFQKDDLLRVALSHVPVTPKQSDLLIEVMNKIRPNLILSGHSHISVHYTVYENDLWSFMHNTIDSDETELMKYRVHEGFMHEITVPTCSYRMGVFKMGYGAAFIDKKKKMVYYSVLWLPNRYKQMAYHLILLLITVSIILYRKFRRCKLANRKLNKQYMFPA